MKRILGIFIFLLIFGGLGLLVYIDFTAHVDEADMMGGFVEELLHYGIHIIICLTVCTIFHNPAHRFSEWIKSLLGVKPHRGHDEGKCH